MYVYIFKLNYSMFQGGVKVLPFIIHPYSAKGRHVLGYFMCASYLN